MPRLTKSVPKYCRHKATGQALVTLNGHDIYLGRHGSKASRAEYDRLIGLWLQNDRRLPSSLSEITVVELCASYWKFAKGYYVKNGKPTDELASIKVVLRYLNEYYGDIGVGDFGPLALKDVRQKMIVNGGSRNYINKNIGRIKRAFRWGVENEIVPVAVHQALATVAGLRKGKTTAKETQPVSPVSDEIANKTLSFLRPVIADMVRLQRLTGCRPGELCVMKPADVDRSGDVWRYVPETHKTQHHGKQRVIFIGPKAQRILQPYILKAGTGYCFHPRFAQNKPLNERSYREAIHRACRKVFPATEELNEAQTKAWDKRHRWNPNQLRHSAATKIRSRYGLEAAQVTLGHASANVTQVYAERDLAKAREIMRKIG